MSGSTKRAKELRYRCPTCGAKQWELCMTNKWIAGFFHDLRRDKLKPTTEAIHER